MYLFSLQYSVPAVNLRTDKVPIRVDKVHHENSSAEGWAFFMVILAEN